MRRRGNGVGSVVGFITFIVQERILISRRIACPPLPPFCWRGQILTSGQRSTARVAHVVCGSDVESRRRKLHLKNVVRLVSYSTFQTSSSANTPAQASHRRPLITVSARPVSVARAVPAVPDRCRLAALAYLAQHPHHGQCTRYMPSSAPAPSSPSLTPPTKIINSFLSITLTPDSSLSSFPNAHEWQVDDV